MWFILLACGQLLDAPPSSQDASPARLYRAFSVNCQGGADFTSIGDAMEAARSGDVIRVAPCTYEESLRFRGKSLTIESTGGPEVTTLVADPGERAINVDDGEGAGTVVQGFTITGGGGPIDPAIEVQFSSLILRDNRITGNHGTYVIYSNTGHVVVERSTFTNNEATEGAVIRERRGMTMLIDSTVHCGDVPVGYFAEHGAAFVDRSTVVCPGGIGVDYEHVDGRVQRTVVDGSIRLKNDALELIERNIVEGVVAKNGISVETAIVELRNVVSFGEVKALGAELTVESSILTGGACGVRADLSTVAIRSSNIWDVPAVTCGDGLGVTLEGVTSVDPLFVDRTAGDLRLSPGSPCIDAGPTDSDYRDPDGSPNDLGAFGGPLSLGGGW
jgi:hypothetical protein